MIVFTTVRCSRLDQIAANGFDEADDFVARSVSGEKLGARAVYCSDEPVTEGELPPDFHVAFALDVPDEVLDRHVVSNKGWLLPLGVANQYRGIRSTPGNAGWPCAIDLDPNVSTPMANLEDIERDDAAGWMKTLRDAIRNRRVREADGG
jgi:hypothetical protein